MTKRLGWIILFMLAIIFAESIVILLIILFAEAISFAEAILFTRILKLKLKNLISILYQIKGASPLQPPNEGGLSTIM
jgi:hypothetical protein